VVTSGLTGCRKSGRDGAVISHRLRSWLIVFRRTKPWTGKSKIGNQVRRRVRLADQYRLTHLVFDYVLANLLSGLGHFRTSAQS
jgi:hypothetical protein